MRASDGFNAIVPELSSAQRRLLIVSYWYPPAVGAAAERIHSFARYLPEHGWDVHILTAAHAGSAAEDPGVTVHRVPDRAAGKGPLFADYDPRAKAPVWKRFLREFIFPDRFRFWWKDASCHFRQLAPHLKTSVVLASFPPASAVLLGMAAAECGAGRLVLDFRDRWLGPGGYQPLMRRTRLAHEAVQRTAISGARGIVTISDAMADALAAEHAYPRGHTSVIPNGYDPVPLRPIESIESLDPLVIVHVGTVIARNRPDLFLDVVSRLRAAKAMVSVRFRFVGNLSKAYLKEAKLDDVVESTGLVAREDARKEMESAPALLLLVGDYVGRWGYNAKLFEYVQTGRPILCLEESPGSNDAALLRQFANERTFFAKLDNAGSIMAAIDALRGYLRHTPQSALHLPAEFTRYSRVNLARELAEYLNRLI